MKRHGLSTFLIPLPFLLASIYCLTTKLAAWDASMRLLGAAVGVIYLAWVVLEVKVSVGEIDKGQSGFDKWTCEVYNLLRWVTVFVAVATPTQWTSLGWWAPVALALYLTGIIYRLIAIKTLGRFYSHRIRVVTGHNVIDTGPYRYMRHPAYCGMLLAHLGFVLFFFSWPAVAVYSLLFIPVVVVRILVEEKTLLTNVEGYRQFAATRKRIVPFVW